MSDIENEDLEIVDVPAWDGEDEEDDDDVDHVHADVLDEIAADAFFASIEPEPEPLPLTPEMEAIIARRMRPFPAPTPEGIAIWRMRMNGRVLCPAPRRLA